MRKKASLQPRRARKKGHGMFLLLGIALFFGGILFLAWVRIAVLQIRYDISHLRQQRDKLLQKNRELTLERASLSSAEEVERRAREELSLTYPQEGQVVILEVRR
ncbi:MAG: cell division protein FtsL [Deltaproteobacteria bacterium]|nr:MAG: cell division protein FtsL [Deltaproteobacteria bacterium]